jgi:osmotically-inducible protein OsmY
MHVGDTVLVKNTGRRALITAQLSKGHYQVEFLPDPAEDPIDRDSSVWEDEGGVYIQDDLQVIASSAEEDQMVSTTEPQTDEQIRHHVLEELKWDTRVQPSEIGVAVDNGIVTLSGWVDSYIKKWAAEEAALRVRGVKAVANEIEVRLPIEAERTDADLAAAALHALEWDANVPLGRVKVAVSTGWVTLEGDVDYQFQKADTEQAVRRLKGVRGVTNQITVRGGMKVAPSPSPSELKRKIEGALIRSAALDAQRITLEVQGSKVVLKGTVRAWAEKQEAERVAWSAPGMTSVENRIIVVP